MTKRIVVFIAVLFAATMLAAQSVQVPSKAFEVATIKRSALEADAGRYMRMQNDHDFIARNYTLKDLVAAAYDLTPQLISGGPKWFDSERFEILAKSPGDVRPSQSEQMAMLQTLIKNRFGFNFHRQDRVLSIYSLDRDNGPVKMVESESPEGPQPLVFEMSPQGAKLRARKATTAELASILQRVVFDRPVVDQTGLSARFDFDLDFLPDESQFGGQFQTRYRTAPSADISKNDSLFIAIRDQLGLRLVAARGPVATLVVDEVQPPSEN